MSKKSNERVTVAFYCKPYVKAYLIANFNAPDEEWPEIVNFGEDKELYNNLLSSLTKNSERYDSRVKCYQCTELVYIEITWDIFYRYGWMLTKTETLRFNKLLEKRVKSILYSFVSALRIVGLPISQCIERFRKRTHITEADWDTDSIRKDLSRNLFIDHSLTDDFLRKIEKNVWCVLSKNRTISHKGYNQLVYETDNV